MRNQRRENVIAWFGIRSDMVYIYVLLFTSHGNSKEQALLTCEYIIIPVDLIQLKSIVQFMKLI